MAEDLFGITFLHHLTHVHEDDMVGNAECLAQRVGDHHDGVGSLQFGKEFFYLVAADRVECTCTLVGEQIGRLHSQTASQTETLLLSTTQAGCRSVETLLDLIPQSHGAQIVAHDLVLLMTVADAVDAAAVGHIVVDAHRQRAGTLWHQADVTAKFREAAAASLEDVCTVEGDLTGHAQAFYAVVETVERAKQRTLAATGGADDASDLVAGNLHVDVLQYVCPMDIDVEVTGLKARSRGVSKFVGHGKGRALSVEVTESKRKETVAKVVDCTCYCIHKRLWFYSCKVTENIDAGEYHANSIFIP